VGLNYRDHAKELEMPLPAEPIVFMKPVTALIGPEESICYPPHFIFTVEELVSFISHVMTLMPGDIIATGTPGGIGALDRGDTIEIRIEGIGTLRNYVG